MSFLDNSGCFYNCFLQVYYGKDPSKYSLRKFKTSAQKTCRLNFWQKLYIIQCSHKVFIYSIVYIDENCRGASSLSRL